MRAWSDRSAHLAMGTPTVLDVTVRERYPARMRWEPTGEVWQYELLDKLPRSVDPTQIEESLRLTPTERLERMQRFAEFLEDVRRAGEHRLPDPD